MNAYILEQLHHLLSRNVIGDKQYDNRYKGFHGELDFNQWYRSHQNGEDLFNGGYLIPCKENTETLDNPVYVTINNHAPDDDYKEIYNHLADISPLQYYIHFESCDIYSWDQHDIMGHGIELPVPKMHVTRFNNNTSGFSESTLDDFLSNFIKKASRKKNSYPIENETKLKHIEKLKQHSTDDLINLYVERLIFDGYIGFGRIKGIPSDIDAITKKTGNLSFLEIKEKDKSKRSPQGFGMDLRRIKSLLTIQQKTSIPYFYIVREINNQKDRNLKGWKYINMTDFSDAIQSMKEIEGGTGMRSEKSNNPTKVCPYEKFKDLV